MHKKAGVKTNQRREFHRAKFAMALARSTEPTISSLDLLSITIDLFVDIHFESRHIVHGHFCSQLGRAIL